MSTREPIRCERCDQYILFMKTKRGKWMPVDAESVDDINEWDYDRERHVSHFDTCGKPKEPEPEPPDTGDEWPDEGAPF